jgi:hypothetical protein
MKTCICVLATLLLGLPLTASAVADSAPACGAAKGDVCGPAQPLALGSAVSGYTTALRSDRTRRGLGLPSLRRLFGKAGPRAQTLADGRLAAAPATAASSGRARAAATAGLARVGAVGNVTVRASVAPGLGAGVDEISFTDQIKGPHGSQTRSIRFTATADACPAAAAGNDNVGKDHGNLLAAEHIVTVQRARGLEIKTDFTVDITGDHEIWGQVNPRAELRGIDPSLTPIPYARIRRVRTARDLRSGRTFREKPFELRYELQSISPLWMDGGFGGFIDKYGNANDDDPADAVVSDRLLNEDAFEAAARTFMTAVESKVRVVFERAETQWRTPNRCLDVRSDAPAQLVPGQSIKVHVSATSKRGDPAASVRSYARYVPYKSAGLGVDPFTFVEPDPDMGADFKVTPPAQAWPDGSPERLQVMLYSTAGIGETDTDFTAQTLPIRWHVLDASMTVHSRGSMPGGTCAAFGGTSGWTTITGTGTGVAQEDPNTTLGRMTPNGPLSGGIWGKAAAKFSDQINGCKSGASGLEPCSMSAADFALPNPFNFGFTIQVPDPASGQAKIHWLVVVPGVGDIGKLPCGVGIANYIPYDKTTQSMPLARLMSTEPQTFTYVDSIHWDQDASGRPASIDYDWRYSITVQRY